MAHGIFGQSMVFAGDVPWHGIGTQLPGNATWGDIKDLVGFYRAEARPLFMPGRPTPLPDRKALVRSDSGEYLSTVGIDYGIVQFDDMAEAVVTAAGDFQAVFHTAGLLGENGIRGWLLGELPGELVVKGDRSPIKRYFLATGAHTGAHPVNLANCATRVVCQNTLGMALRERDGAAWTIRHTRNAAAAVKAAAGAFAQLVSGYEKFGELANTLADIGFSDEAFDATLDTVIPIPQDGKPHPRLEENRNTLRELWGGRAKGLEGLEGTAWGAWQAWTEFSDHHRPSLPETTATRLDNIWFGTGSSQKREALYAIAKEAELDLRAVMAVA